MVTSTVMTTLKTSVSAIFNMVVGRWKLSLAVAFGTIRNSRAPLSQRTANTYSPVPRYSSKNSVSPYLKAQKENN